MLRRADQDAGFWLERARRAGDPVLELACGTGRLTFALAGAGVQIVGLDNDPVMLAAAARRRRLPGSGSGRPDGYGWPLLLAADMRRFALAGRFQLVFVGYNSLQLLTAPGDMAACLNRAREHLTPGGFVGLEVTDFQGGGADGPDEGGSPVLLAEAEGVRLSGTLVHDLAGRVSRYRRHFAGEGWGLESEVVVRSLDRAELALVLAASGLRLVRSWVDGATVRAIAAAGQ